MVFDGSGDALRQFDRVLNSIRAQEYVTIESCAGAITLISSDALAIRRLLVRYANQQRVAPVQSGLPGV